MASRFQFQVSDKMEGKPTGISRLKLPTRIAQLSTTSKPTSLREIQAYKTNLAIPQGIALSRRSKSFSDLRSNTLAANKPLKPLGETISKRIPLIRPPLYKAPSTSTTNLRKRPNEQPTQTDVKPKVSKPAKPAPYDYKARYNLLADKHKIIIQSNKDMKEQLVKVTEELVKVTEENDIHKNESLKLETKLQTLEKNFTKLEQDANTITLTLTTENTKLRTILSEYREKIAYLELQCENCKNELMKEEERARFLLNLVQDLKGNIRVFCRVRPPLEGENDRLMVNCAFLDETSLELKKSKDSISMFSGKPTDLKQEFSFDRVFPPESTQEDVFEDLSQLVQSALDGYNICVFAYGQTGSGKTFTMQGDEFHLGMIPRSIDLLFQNIENMKMRGWIFQVEASFLEIYNESIVDLLNPNDKLPYEIRYNEGKGSIVTNLRIECIDSSQSLLVLMFAAQKNRAVASTNFNEKSSRSHAVTKITVNSFQSETNLSYQGSLNLVDLAGSESAKTSTTERLTETKNINKSLSTLGNVMLALHNKETHIPYRNSKLTYLLQSCLGGNSKTLMFVNISPFEDCYNETINSLRFASKVKTVKNNSKRNYSYK